MLWLRTSPLATVALTKRLVDALVSVSHVGVSWENARPAVIAGSLIAAVAILSELLQGLLDWIRTAQSELIQDHISYREPNTDIFIDGFQRLQRDGKVLVYGLSSSDFAFIKDFNSNGNCATLQIDYSILNRTAESEIFPYCQNNNIGVIIRGALANGDKLQISSDGGATWTSTNISSKLAMLVDSHRAT